MLAVLLNAVVLEPGQAIYLGAGNVHSYLRGLAVEVMANSDNVLRCGLTSKHVDVAEVLAVTDFTELADPIWPAEAGRFVVPVPDFALQRLDVAGEQRLDAGGPGDQESARIVLVTARRRRGRGRGATPRPGRRGARRCGRHAGR